MEMAIASMRRSEINHGMLILIVPNRFVYGGQSDDFDSSKFTSAQVQQNLELDSIYVLSLPAFVW